MAGFGLLETVEEVSAIRTRRLRLRHIADLFELARAREVRGVLGLIAQAELVAAGKERGQKKGGAGGTDDGAMHAVLQRSRSRLVRAPYESVDLKPIFACVPSQNGLLPLPPQRHSRAWVTRATTRPVPEVISRLPRTRRGPSVSGSTESTPSRTASMSVFPESGSPEAVNFTSLWEPSQKGLFFDAPQRQSVARNTPRCPS